MEYYTYMGTYYVTRAELSKLRRDPEKYATMTPIPLKYIHQPHYDPRHTSWRTLTTRDVETFQSKQWMITYARKHTLEIRFGTLNELYKLMVDYDADAIHIKEISFQED